MCCYVDPREHLSDVANMLLTCSARFAQLLSAGGAGTAFVCVFEFKLSTLLPLIAVESALF